MRTAELTRANRALPASRSRRVSLAPTIFLRLRMMAFTVRPPMQQARLPIADLTPGRHRVRTVSATWNPRVGVTADPDGTLDAQTEVVIVAGQTIGPLRFGYGPHDLALTASSAAGNFVPGEFVRYRLDYANRGSPWKRATPGCARSYRPQHALWLRRAQRGRVPTGPNPA